MELAVARKAHHILGKLKSYQAKREALTNGSAQFIYDNGSGKREIVSTIDVALNDAFVTMMLAYVDTEIAKLEQELKEL